MRKSPTRCMSGLPPPISLASRPSERPSAGTAHRVLQATMVLSRAKFTRLLPALVLGEGMAVDQAEP